MAAASERAQSFDLRGGGWGWRERRRTRYPTCTRLQLFRAKAGKREARGWGEGVPPAPRAAEGTEPASLPRLAAGPAPGNRRGAASGRKTSSPPLFSGGPDRGGNKKHRKGAFHPIPRVSDLRGTAAPPQPVPLPPGDTPRPPAPLRTRHGRPPGWPRAQRRPGHLPGEGGSRPERRGPGPGGLSDGARREQVSRCLPGRRRSRAGPASARRSGAGNAPGPRPRSPPPPRNTCQDPGTGGGRGGEQPVP